MTSSKKPRFPCSETHDPLSHFKHDTPAMRLTVYVLSWTLELADRLPKLIAAIGLSALCGP
jgi:hypothetical protein